MQGCVDEIIILIAQPLYLCFTYCLAVPCDGLEYLLVLSWEREYYLHPLFKRGWEVKEGSVGFVITKQLY